MSPVPWHAGWAGPRGACFHVLSHKAHRPTVSHIVPQPPPPPLTSGSPSSASATLQAGGRGRQGKACEL